MVPPPKAQGDGLEVREEWMVNPETNSKFTPENGCFLIIPKLKLDHSFHPENGDGDFPRRFGFLLRQGATWEALDFQLSQNFQLQLMVPLG